MSNTLTMYKKGKKPLSVNREQVDAFKKQGFDFVSPGDVVLDEDGVVKSTKGVKPAAKKED